jgi:hypothetical protein
MEVRKSSVMEPYVKPPTPIRALRLKVTLVPQQGVEPTASQPRSTGP